MGFLRKALGLADKDPLDEEWEASAAGPRQPAPADAEPRQANWDRRGSEHRAPTGQYGVEVGMVGEPYRARSAADLMLATEEAGEPLVELKIVGESHHQDALRSISGPKEAMGKQMLVGAVLRCEPTNGYDRDAIRVEVMGQLLGYADRQQAALLSSPIQRTFGGALEAKGLIVGGWADDYGEGYYGVRVWITSSTAARLGVAPGDIEPALRPPRPRWPAAPPLAPGERRLGPTDADIAAGRFGSQVTVTCEEHYQPAIVAAMPAGWEAGRSWPLLVELAVADCNPHSKQKTPCIEVRVGGRQVGFLTPAMTGRHQGAVAAAGAERMRVTATAQAYWGTKGSAELWRLKVHMAAPGQR